MDPPCIEAGQGAFTSFLCARGLSTLCPSLAQGKRAQALQWAVMGWDLPRWPTVKSLQSWPIRDVADVSEKGSLCLVHPCSSFRSSQVLCQALQAHRRCASKHWNPPLARFKAIRFCTAFIFVYTEQYQRTGGAFHLWNLHSVAACLFVPHDVASRWVDHYLPAERMTCRTR